MSVNTKTMTEEEKKDKSDRWSMKGSSSTESGKASDKTIVVRREEGDDDNTVTISEILTPGLPTDESGEVTFTELLTEIVKEGETGTWIEFWELIMQSFGKESRQKFEDMKTQLIALIDLLESIIKFAQQAMRTVFLFISKMLSLAATAILILKGLIAALKSLLAAITKALDIPFLKGEAKVAWFDLFKELEMDTRLFSQTGSVITEKTRDMCENWMNRPTAEDELCTLIFIPLSMPAEIARTIDAALDFKELMKKHLSEFDKWKEDRKKKLKFAPGYGNSLINILKNLSETFPRARRYYDKDILSHIDQEAERALEFHTRGGYQTFSKSISAYMANLFYEQYSLLDIAAEVNMDGNSPGSGSIPRVLDYAMVLDSKGKVNLETNFKADNKYISAIYKRSESGNPEAVFIDPVFIFLRVLQDPEVQTLKNNAIELYYAYYDYKFSIPEVAQNRTAKESQLLGRLNTTIVELFGSRIKRFLIALSRLPEEKVELLFYRRLIEIMYDSSENHKDAIRLDDYKKYIKNFKNLDYGTRTVINPLYRLYSNELPIKNAKEGDEYLFIFEDIYIKYLGVDFLDKGDVKIDSYRYKGSIEAIKNTMKISVTVKPETQGLYPRWYGVGMPAAVNNWSASKLLAEIMPEGVLDATDKFFDLLDNLDKLLNELLKGVDELQKKLDKIERELNRYFDILFKISRELKAFIRALSLANLPTLYFAVWRGSSKQIPEIVSKALMQKNWFNSTYAGLFVFVSAAGAEAAIKMYEAIETAENEIDARLKGAKTSLKASYDSFTDWEDYSKPFNNIKKQFKDSGKILDEGLVHEKEASTVVTTDDGVTQATEASTAKDLISVWRAELNNYQRLRPSNMEEGRSRIKYDLSVAGD